MDDGVFALNNTTSGTPPDSFMDWDYMDELFLGGCWLETTDGSEFLHQRPPTSTPLFDSPFLGHALEESPSQKDSQEERQRSSLPENLSINLPQGRYPAKNQSLGENMINVTGPSAQPENYLVGGSEPSRRWWIGPEASHGPKLSVMDRLIRALGDIRDYTRNKDVLVQVWVPVSRSGRKVLITNGQPFEMDLTCPRLASYRDISVNYQFPAEEDSKEAVGLPGRVFMGKVPEWTPDVRFFRREEYPRVGHAQHCGVRGTLAVPVFEQGSHSCLGVIEVVTTVQKINYRPELESVCKALEAVDLSSSEVGSTESIKACDGSYQAALPEIIEVLRSACETHRLPLAQTWVSCIQQGKGGCRHSDENFIHCVSTVDSACYVADPRFQDFHEACSEHHLLKGQGVAGKAFLTNQPCFSSDLTSFSKTEYPLSHHARMFGLHAAVAIRLRSIYTSKADLVLEFFLPTDCIDAEEQEKVLSSLSLIIHKVCWSLRVISEKELKEEIIRPVGEVMILSDGLFKREEVLKMEHSQSTSAFNQVSSWAFGQTGAQMCNDDAPSVQDGNPREVMTTGVAEGKQRQYDSKLRVTVAFGGDCSTSMDGSCLNVSKTVEKRRKRVEKTITLQMLQQYFAGSLKDAAKSIGVCPTTLKRICRQHGIKRWPSRKIKKVGHSLQKIQLVIDSVQGASGAFQIDSFYSNFPELASPNLSGANPFSALKSSGDLKLLQRRPEEGSFKPQAEAACIISPSSSGSQTSSSSPCCSSGTQPPTCTPASEEAPLVKENSGNGLLKRARSDAQLLTSADEGPKPIPRSRSQIALSQLPKSDLGVGTQMGACGHSQEGNYQRVKVTYGQEKIRFRMQSNWGYLELLQEIGRRFSIDDLSGYHLKYLDDDSEWVLLTCDADLEECMDVCQSSPSHTIKLSLLHTSQKHYGSSLGSNSTL